MLCLDDEERRMVTLVAQLRAEHGLGGLRQSEPLTIASTRHATDMATHNFIGHTGSEGSSAFDRIKAAGYPASWMGENAAAGNAGADATFAQWTGSPGHLANLVNPNYTEIGVARMAGTKWHYVWCQTFGGGDTARARVCGDEGAPPIVLAPPTVPDEPAPRIERPTRHRVPRLDGLAGRIIADVRRRLGLR